MGSASDRERAWPEFAELWSQVVERAREPGTAVVVEGERDLRSLRRLHLDGNVVLLHHGRPVSGVAHELAESARIVIVLTDWDTEGGTLARRLKEFLEPSSARLDLDTRRRLARILRGELVHVEGLAGWARRTCERLGVSFDGWLAELDP